MPADPVLVLAPGAGRPVPRRYGEQTVIKAADPDTRGAYAVRENTVPPASAASPSTSTAKPKRPSTSWRASSPSSPKTGP